MSTCNSPHQQHSDKCCWNCKTTQSPLWRKFTPTEDVSAADVSVSTAPTYLCNKCGLFFKRNKKQRPLNLDSHPTPTTAAAPMSCSTAPEMDSKPKKKNSTKRRNKKVLTSSTTVGTTTTLEPLVIGADLNEKKRKRNANPSAVTSYGVSAVVHNTSGNRRTSPTTPVQVIGTSDDIFSAVISTTPTTKVVPPYKRRMVHMDDPFAQFDFQFNETTPISNEDLDAICNSHKKSKNNSDDSYQGFGSPIVQHNSVTTAPVGSALSGAALDQLLMSLCNQQYQQQTLSDMQVMGQLQSLIEKANMQDAQNQANFATSVPNNNAQLYHYPLQQPTMVYNDNTFSQPNHIMDWYNNDGNEMTCNNQFNFGDKFTGDISQGFSSSASYQNHNQDQNLDWTNFSGSDADTSSLVKLFGYEQVGLFDNL